jgi:hypothetical protein
MKSFYDHHGFEGFEEEACERADVDFRPPVQCNRCGSFAVRWRQQGGQWVLFSLKAGVLHDCPSRVADASEFD